MQLITSKKCKFFLFIFLLVFNAPFSFILSSFNPPFSFHCVSHQFESKSNEVKAKKIEIIIRDWKITRLSASNKHTPRGNKHIIASHRVYLIWSFQQHLHHMLLFLSLDLLLLGGRFAPKHNRFACDFQRSGIWQRIWHCLEQSPPHVIPDMMDSDRGSATIVATITHPRWKPRPLGLDPSTVASFENPILPLSSCVLIRVWIWG